jgi:hypothetical protein
MSYGLSIYNSANELLINELYANYYYKSSGYVTTTTAFSSNYYATITKPSGTTNPILAIRPHTAGQCIFGWHWTTTESGVYVVTDTSGGRVDYCWFTEQSPSVGGNPGLEVRNASGNVVFNSNDRQMKIVTVDSFSWTPTTTELGDAVAAGNYFVTNNRDVIDPINNYFIIDPCCQFSTYPNPYSPPMWWIDMWAGGLRYYNTSYISFIKGRFSQGVYPGALAVNNWGPTHVLMEVTY